MSKKTLRGAVSALLLLILSATKALGCPYCAKVTGYERILLKGRLIEVSPPIAVLETENGTRYTLKLGPYWFWNEKGISLKKGTRAEVRGFKKGYLVFPIELKTENATIRFRDERGVPLFKRGMRRCW